MSATLLAPRAVANKVLGVGLYTPRAVQLPLVTSVYRRPAG